MIGLISRLHFVKFDAHLVNQSLSSLLTSDPTFITTTHVSHILLLSPIPTQLLLSLQSNHPTLPIFHVYSLGFVSSLRILLPELTIVETHPDSLVDLRLANPWPELSELAAEHTKDITSMSKHRHGHIPYVSLLLHYLTEWKLANGGKLPLARSERRKFAEKVTEEMRTDVPGGGEENYEEAVAAITMHVKAHDISSTTREVLADPSANDLSPGVSLFH